MSLIAFTCSWRAAPCRKRSSDICLSRQAGAPVGTIREWTFSTILLPPVKLPFNDARRCRNPGSLIQRPPRQQGPASACRAKRLLERPPGGYDRRHYNQQSAAIYQFGHSTVDRSHVTDGKVLGATRDFGCSM